MIDDENKLGTNLRIRREQLGLTQRQLAEKAGIKHTHVSRVERGEALVSLQVLARLGNVLGVRSEWLLGGDADTPPPPHVTPDDLSPDEKVAIAYYRRLARSDRRFAIRILAALAEQDIKKISEKAVEIHSVWQPIGQGVTGDVPPPPSEKKNAASPVLAIRGDELSGLGIHDGDLVATSKRAPKSGDVVVVLLDDIEPIVRLWFPREKNMVELKSTKPNDKPILVKKSALKLLSVVTHVWRERID